MPKLRDLFQHLFPDHLDLGDLLAGELSDLIGERTALSFGRNLTKPLDRLIGRGAKEGLALPDLQRAAEALAADGAEALTTAAALLATYPRFAAAVEAARHEAGGAGLKAAQAERLRQQDALREALAKAARAVGGE